MSVLTALAAVTVRAESPTFTKLDLKAGVVSKEPIPLSQYTLCEVDGAVTYDLRSDGGTDGTGRSAATVPEGGVVVFNLKRDSVLTLIGDRGSDKVGGGAGLCVPAGAEVYVTGLGKLIATGGAGMNGGRGGDADNTRIDGQYVEGSRGGVGGRGGWGAGAGIGGVGGKPGVGGERPDGDRRYTDYAEIEKLPTKVGKAGGAGGSGGASGKIYLLYGVTVTATAGEAGLGGGAGNGSKGDRYHTSGGWYYRCAGAGGGGGGGGGGRGRAIGGGGGGGSGGGSGANGGFTSRWWETEKSGDGDLQVRRQGQGGHGGLGGKIDGRFGTDGKHGDGESSGVAAGGASGAAGAVGSDEGFFCGASVVCAAEGCSGVVPSPGEGLNIPATIYFNRNYSGAEVKSLEAKFMGPMPTADIPIRKGYRFLGWFDLAEGGNCYYGASGRPVRRCCEFVGELTLYAHWEQSAAFMTVNTNEDGTDLGDGKVTLRDAVKAIVEDPNMVGSNGFRRIEFDLPEGKESIELTSELVVGSGVRPFEINGLLDIGRCVTIRSKNRDCRLFSLGTDVSCRNVNFAGGAADYGAALRLTGTNQTVFIENCSFIGNRATNHGGAIFQSASGELIVMNATFADNAAEDTHGRGGAVSGEGEASFVNCTFSHNRAGRDGGAVFVNGVTSLANCTFAGDTLDTDGNGFSVYCDQLRPLYAINTVFADGEKSLKYSAYASQICCSVGKPTDFFTVGALATTNDLSGVRQIYYSPLPWESTGLKDAAEIYHDASYNNIACVYGTNTVELVGNKLLADIRLGTDQIGSLRLTPVRGAIRLASGSARSVANLEGRLWDADDENWAANKSEVVKSVTIAYDDGTRVTPPHPSVSTDANGYFAAPIEVDGSDGRTHNATSVVVTLEKDVTATLAVNTAPYALVAASAEYVGLTELATVSGKENSVNLMLVDGGVVGNELTLGRDFSAGTVRGNAEIELGGIDLKGGQLEWFNGSEGVTYAQLSSSGVTFSGGSNSESGNLRPNDNRQWTATADGFFQLKVTNNATEPQITLRVGDYTVTSAQSSAQEQLVWTIPVRKDETVKLMTGPSSGACRYDAQFVYFGKED